MTSANEHVEGITSWQAQNELASAWMKRGIALLELNTPAELANAVRCFDEAIQLRSGLPLAANPWFRYGLAAGWLNRADAMTRIGSDEMLEKALRSCDQALAHLRWLPLEESPLFKKRLAIAWLHRGIALERQKKFAEAARAFDESIAVLKDERGGTVSGQEVLLGCEWMNRGNALLQLPEPDAIAAAEAARTALGLLAHCESVDLVAAEAGLKARHVLCRALAEQMDARAAEPSLKEEIIGESTDAVEEGIKLGRAWESRGETRFQGLARELFCFGAGVYHKFQPQFVGEYLLEMLEAKDSGTGWTGPELRAAVTYAAQGAFHELRKSGFNRLDAPGFDDLLRRVGELSLVEKRLAGLTP